MSQFETSLNDHQLKLTRDTIHTLQVNIGKRCNQACSHCHVESSPTRTENMNKTTIDRLIKLLQNAPGIKTVDITGGAPELNPYFRYFVQAIYKMKKKVIDRCNLTILFEPGQETTSKFLANHQVEIVASLPCYLEENVNKQRGKGVFSKSIEGLKQLNQIGYGQEETELVLNLVYNPVGPHLPPNQTDLEKDYTYHLKKEFGIKFNQLFTITNMPIKRYEQFLKRLKKWEEYNALLKENFNPLAATEVMCQSLVSVGWEGQLYDCDFNQMLEIPLSNQKTTIWDIDTLNDLPSNIAWGNHCFGCTAGAGSSCGGATLNDK